jgi:hypothetical protein
LIWNRCQVDPSQVRSNHSMMTAQDLAVRPQNHWLQAGFVPIKKPVPHRIDHLVDLISVEVLFPLGRFESLRTEPLSSAARLEAIAT